MRLLYTCHLENYTAWFFTTQSKQSSGFSERIKENKEKSFKDFLWFPSFFPRNLVCLFLPAKRKKLFVSQKDCTCMWTSIISCEVGLVHKAQLDGIHHTLASPSCLQALQVEKRQQIFVWIEEKSSFCFVALILDM